MSVGFITERGEFFSSTPDINKVIIDNAVVHCLSVVNWKTEGELSGALAVNIWYLNLKQVVDLSISRSTFKC